MESLDPHTAAYFFDNVLDLDFDDDDDQIPQTSAAYDNHHHHHTPLSLLRCRDGLISELVEEEELEWISNKDTFPMVESLVDFMPSIATSNYNGINNNHRSPISVLENSSGGFDGNLSHGMNLNNSRNMMMISLCNFKVPGKARTKHRSRRRDMTLAPQFQCWSVHQKAIKRSKSSSMIGRKCLHCGSEKTPQWRAGPLGPKTLCNACGVRYKSGRLCDEYRPASSPTFSPDIHSNSHRKIMEMWRQKMVNNGSGLKPTKID